MSVLSASITLYILHMVQRICIIHMYIYCQKGSQIIIIIMHHWIYVKMICNDNINIFNILSEWLSLGKWTTSPINLTIKIHESSTALALRPIIKYYMLPLYYHTICVIVKNEKKTQNDTVERQYLCFQWIFTIRKYIVW